MSTPATMYQVDSAPIRVVRLVPLILICGLVAVALYATSTGRPQQAAADTPQVAGAATSSSEQLVSPPPSTARSQTIGDDARQETALTVLLLLAAANARAKRAPEETRLPGQLGSRQAVDVGRVQ